MTPCARTRCASGCRTGRATSRLLPMKERGALSSACCLSGARGRLRQREVEARAAGELALGPDAVAMELDEAFADVEAQAQAGLVLARGRGLVEALEEARQLLLRHAAAGVGDREPDLVVLLVGRD